MKEELNEEEEEVEKEKAELEAENRTEGDNDEEVNVRQGESSVGDLLKVGNETEEEDVKLVDAKSDGNLEGTGQEGIMQRMFVSTMLLSNVELFLSCKL